MFLARKFSGELSGNFSEQICWRRTMNEYLCVCLISRHFFSCFESFFPVSLIISCSFWKFFISYKWEKWIIEIMNLNKWIIFNKTNSTNAYIWHTSHLDWNMTLSRSAVNGSVMSPSPNNFAKTTGFLKKS